MYEYLYNPCIANMADFNPHYIWSFYKLQDLTFVVLRLCSAEHDTTSQPDKWDNHLNCTLSLVFLYVYLTKLRYLHLSNQYIKHTFSYLHL